MIDDALIGPAYPEYGWVPAPRYLLRRARVMRLAEPLAAGGKLLEIGPGAGVLLTEFAKRGFACEALDLSAEARELSSKVFAASGTPIRMRERASDDLQQQFDAIFAFEVLEHIEDDLDALRLWKSWLKPGGRLLLSVPAHMRLWTARDEWAGHVRRYERAALETVVRQAGFELETFECYGFPLSNLSEFVSAPIFARGIRSGGSDAAADRRSNNDRSGIDRGADMKLYPLVKSIPGKLAMRTAFFLQDRFLHTDLGSGYLLRARRP